MNRYFDEVIQFVKDLDQLAALGHVETLLYLLTEFKLKLKYFGLKSRLQKKR